MPTLKYLLSACLAHPSPGRRYTLYPEFKSSYHFAVMVRKGRVGLTLETKCWTGFTFSYNQLRLPGVQIFQARNLTLPWFLLCCSTFSARTVYHCGLTENARVQCAEPRWWPIPRGEMEVPRPTSYYFDHVSLTCEVNMAEYCVGPGMFAFIPKQKQQ